MTFTAIKLLFSAFFLCFLLQSAQVNALPTVGFTSVSSNESETSGLITISLERTVQTNISTEVTVELSGSATKDSDYVVSGSLVVTFPANDTSQQNINIFIINDQEVESPGRETINLTIQENAEYDRKVDYSSHIVRIADDDVSINCQNSTVNESAGIANVTITRSGSSQALSASHSIGCFTVSGTANPPDDYTTANTQISFQSLNQEMSMIITIKNDNVPETEENFKVRCGANDARVQIQSSCRDATVIIEDEDTYAFFCPGGHAASVSEDAGTYSVDICRVGVLSTAPTVQLCRTSEGGTDPSITGGCENVTFTANDDRTTGTFNINNDTTGEQEHKTFQIYLQSFDFAVTINDTAREDITLIDNDNTFYLTNTSELRMTEGDGVDKVNITINRVGKTSVAASVRLVLLFAYNADSADCNGTSPRVIDFSANETSRTITTCTVVDDRIVEDDETFNVTISGKNGSNVRSGESERTITLISDDVNITCQGTSLKEANGPATIRLDRTGATAVTANNIQCSTANDTAFSPNDYQPKSSATVSFAINDLTQNFNVVIENDREAEENETLTVTCDTSDPKVVVDSSCNSVQINIINDDTYVYFCPGYSTSIEENVGSYTVRLCRVGVLEDTHTVGLCRGTDSVSLPHDYPSVQAQCDEIVFAAYDTVKELDIPVTNDTRGEQEYKTFNISMNTTDTSLTFNGTTSYVVTIQDDDNTFYLTNTSELRMTEGDGVDKVNITINRVGKTSVAANVRLVLLFAYNADSADCNGTSPRVIDFSANETSRTITTCTVVDDRIVEDDETFNVTISGKNGSNVRSGESERTIKLISDDVNITCQGTSLKEANGPATIRLNRTGATAVTLNDIQCSTANDTAFSPNDYQPKSSTTVPFAIDDLTQNFNVVIENDRVVEGNESLTVTCDTSDSRVVVDPSCNSVQINIINDDTYVYFCPGYSTFIEENVGLYTVRLCRVGVLEDTHTVGLCRGTDSLSLPNDYPAVQAQCDDIVFAAYDTVKELDIPVTNDTRGEQEYKTFNISMNTTDSGFTFNGTTSYVVTIQDDDNTFYLTNTSELRMTEGDGVDKVNITINRVGKTSVDASVRLVLLFAYNADSADCNGTSPRVIDFSANETSRTITACTVVDDRIVEDDETFNVTISGENGSNVRSGESERTIKLISDDVNITCQGTSLKEANGPATIRLNRTGATAVTLNDIQCSTANDTAFSPTDFQSQTSATVSFVLNDLTENFTVIVENDRIVEQNESLTVTCNTSDPKVVVDPSCSDIPINIINDDTYVYFCPGYPTSIEENVGSYTVRLCRVGVLEDNHTVSLCRSSDSVSLPHDYPAVQAQCDDIVFAVNDTVREHVIPVTNDTWGEQEYKTFNISMNATDSRVTFNDTKSYVVTIHDDDNTFCFTRTSLKVYEEQDKFVNLTIRRTGAITASNASVIINTSPQTAITPEDYTEPILNQRITFLVGEVEKNVSVNIVNDKLVEDDQTFQLSLRAGVDGSTVFPECQTSTVTIVSNDVNIFCRDRRGYQSVYENKGPVVMEFTREGSLQYNHTMRVRTIDGTAKSGEDYTAIDKTLTFAPHQTSIKENVLIVNDNVLEPDERFRLSVTSSDDRVHMICPGTHLTILNDDTFIRCANQNIEVNEGNKTVYFTLKREGVLSSASPIWFGTKDGTAFDKSDYEPVNKVSRTFLPGQVYMTLSVDLVDDEYREEDETFSVIIGSYVPTTLTSGDNCTLITIKDDDPDRMTEQQAQELLIRRRNFLIVLGVAGAFMALVVVLFLCCICYLLRRFKRYLAKEEQA